MTRGYLRLRLRIEPVRLVEVTIPPGEREAVVETLVEMDVDHYLTDATSARGSDREHTAVATFPLPRNAVQPVVDELREAGLSENAHVVVVDAEVDTSRRFEELAKRFGADSGGSRIARDEIIIQARELSPNFRTFLFLTLVSAVVAAAGLLLDSPAVVVGSMVIAPLVGPALSASVGTVLDDANLFRRGVKLQVVGGIASILGATVFAVVVRSLYLFPPTTDITAISQISGRLTPDFLSLIVALGAGAAGVFSLATGVSTALVGVMIAAALIPPAAAVGIGIAWGAPMVAASSGVLVLVNILSINLSAMLTLRYLGYQPKNWFQLERSRTETAKRIGVLLVAIAMLSVFLGGVTLSTVQDSQFENQATAAIDDLVGDPSDPYADANVIDVQVHYRSASMLGQRAFANSLPFHEPERVVVTVGVPRDERHPDLAGRIRDSIRERTGDQVAVDVRYVEVDRAR